MSYLTTYRPYLWLMFLLGVSPLLVRNDKAYQNACILMYTVGLHLLTFAVTTVLFVWRIESETINEIKAIANLFQGISCAFLYFQLAASCSATGHRQVAFLNRLDDFDRKCQNTIPQFRTIVDNDDDTIVITFVGHILFCIFYYCINRYVDLIVIDIQPLWHYLLWQCLSNLMITVPCAVWLHLRFCARLIGRRYSLICGQLLQCRTVTELHRLCDLLHDLELLRRHFEWSYGLAAMWNAIMDFMEMTVSIFMTIVHALDNDRMHSFWLTMLIFSLPIAKQMLFVSVVNEFGEQDERLRTIFMGKGQHMDGQKMVKNIFFS